MSRVLITILCVFLFSGCRRGESDIYIVPKGFYGYVLILFDQENGTKATYEGDKRVYIIPPSGILRTQLKHETGWSDFPLFYYETIDSQNRIRFELNGKSIPRDTAVAYGLVTGTVKLDNGKRQVFVRFYIGNDDQMNKAHEEFEKLDIEKLATEI